MLIPSKIYAVKTRHPHSFAASFGRQRLAAGEAGSIAGQRSRQKYEKKYAKWKLCVAVLATRTDRHEPDLRRARPLSEHPENIQPQRIHHQAEQQHHPHHLRIFNEFIARLTPTDHLHQRK